jgi:hypothetical protein
MGPTKLSEIKAELKRIFKKTTDDPVEWLEHEIRERQQDQSKKRSPEVLESILRVLKEATTKKRRKRKVAKIKS